MERYQQLTAQYTLLFFLIDSTAYQTVIATTTRFEECSQWKQRPSNNSWSSQGTQLIVALYFDSATVVFCSTCVLLCFVYSSYIYMCTFSEVVIVQNLCLFSRVCLPKINVGSTNELHSWKLASQNAWFIQIPTSDLLVRQSYSHVSDSINNAQMLLSSNQDNN